MYVLGGRVYQTASEPQQTKMCFQLGAYGIMHQQVAKGNSAGSSKCKSHMLSAFECHTGQDLRSHILVAPL